MPPLLFVLAALDPIYAVGSIAGALGTLAAAAKVYANLGSDRDLKGLERMNAEIQIASGRVAGQIESLKEESASARRRAESAEQVEAELRTENQALRARIRELENTAGGPS